MTVDGIKLYSVGSLVTDVLLNELLLSNFCRDCNFESGASCGNERQSVVY